MSLKGLRNYEYFDADAFFEGKRLMVLRTFPWTDFPNKDNICGTKIETVIFEDNTDYGDSEITNLFEKVVIKTTKKNLSIPAKTEIKCADIDGVLYGEYRNQLSLKCDNIKIVKPTA